MNLAPIVLFTYNRPFHTKQVLDSLAENKEAKESILYIYCDGAKENVTNEEFKKIDEVRDFVNKESRFKKVIVTIREKNKGLADSIIEGVTDIVNAHGKIIVLEDDIVTSVGFLKYMNDALSLYEHNESVMHISGYMYPHNSNLPETFFFNVPLCWGWATWKSSWIFFNKSEVFLWQALIQGDKLSEFDKFGGNYLSSQLALNILGDLNTWFIKWHATVFLKKGYTLYPGISLVDNIGFDNTGVHNGENPEFKNGKLSNYLVVEEIALVENMQAATIIKDFYKNLTTRKIKKTSLRITFKIKLVSFIRRLFYRIFSDLKEGLKYNIEISSDNIYLGKYCKIYPKAKLSNSIIGNYTYVAENSMISNSIIGRFCSIGPNFLCGWGIHPTNYISTSPMFYSTMKQNGMTLCSENKVEERKQIKIGNDVFVGANVTVLDGVSVGDGAVIGAGAVVSKDIPPYAIAVGCPIKIIGYRFNDDIVARLLASKWWEYDIEKLSLVEEHFLNVEAFLSKIDKQ